MEWIELIGIFISSGVTLIVCMINNHYQQDKTRSLMEYRLGELEKKVDKHNNLVERTYKLEEEIHIQEEKISNIERRSE